MLILWRHAKHSGLRIMIRKLDILTVNCTWTMENVNRDQWWHFIFVFVSRFALNVMKINKTVHEVPTCCSRPVPFWLVTLLILLPSGTFFWELCSKNSIKTQSTINFAQTQIHKSHEMVSIFLSEITFHSQFLFFWVFFYWLFFFLLARQQGRLSGSDRIQFIHFLFHSFNHRIKKIFALWQPYFFVYGSICFIIRAHFRLHYLSLDGATVSFI